MSPAEYFEKVQCAYNWSAALPCFLRASCCAAAGMEARETQTASRTVQLMMVQEKLQYFANLPPCYQKAVSSMYPLRPVATIPSATTPEAHRPLSPPPGFCAPACTSANYDDDSGGGVDDVDDDDLDVNALVEEFRATTGVHEEYESLMLVRGFLIENLRRRGVNACADLRGGVSVEKLAEATVALLRKVGLDVISLKTHGLGGVFAEGVCEKLAVEVCCNEFMSFEEILRGGGRKKRMAYTKNF